MYVLTHGKPDSRQVKQSFKCNKSSIPCGVKLAKYSPSVQNVCFCQNKQNVSKNRQTNDRYIAMDKSYRTINKIEVCITMCGSIREPKVKRMNKTINQQPKEISEYLRLTTTTQPVASKCGTSCNDPEYSKQIVGFINKLFSSEK